MQRHRLHYPLRKYIRPCHLIQHFPIASFDPLECGRDLFIALKCQREEKKTEIRIIIVAMSHLKCHRKMLMQRDPITNCYIYLR